MAQNPPAKKFSNGPTWPQSSPKPDQTHWGQRQTQEIDLRLELPTMRHKPKPERHLLISNLYQVNVCHNCFLGDPLPLPQNPCSQEANFRLGFHDVIVTTVLSEM